MRISDWNSDVCSSDLQRGDHVLGIEFGAVMESDAFAQIEFPMRRIDCPPFGRQLRVIFGGTTAVDQGVPTIGRASCRESVCQYVLTLVVAVSLKKIRSTDQITTISSQYRLSLQ